MKNDARRYFTYMTLILRGISILTETMRRLAITYAYLFAMEVVFTEVFCRVFLLLSKNGSKNVTIKLLNSKLPPCRGNPTLHKE